MPPTPKKLLITAAILSATAMASAEPLAPGEWAPEVSLGGHVFPAWVAVGAAPGFPSAEAKSDAESIGDSGACLAVLVAAPGAGATYSLDIRAAKGLAATTLSGVLDREGAMYRLQPRTDLSIGDLARLDSAEKIDVTFTLALGDGAPMTKTLEATLHAPGDCPVAFDGEPRLAWTLAAFADEDSRAVDRLVSDAERLGIAKSFSGAPGDSDEAIRRAFALTTALGAEVKSFGESAWSDDNGLRAVAIRSHEDTLSDSGVTVADGALLLAAAFRKAGLNAVVAVDPPRLHAGIRPDDGGSTLLLVDIGKLALAEFDAGHSEPMLADLATADTTLAARVEWPRFAAAANSAMKDYHGNSTEWRVIELSAAREMGIKPLDIRD